MSKSFRGLPKAIRWWCRGCRKCATAAWSRFCRRRAVPRYRAREPETCFFHSEAALQLPHICIRRPVFASVLSLIIILIGLISSDRLTVREYPAIDEPVVSVRTEYKG